MNSEQENDLQHEELLENNSSEDNPEYPAGEIKSENEEPVTEQKAEELSAEQKLQKELDEMKDKHLRIYSEFENYKRRTAKERLDLMLTANKELMLAMLPVLDDFDRALKSMADARDIVAVKEGVELVSQKFKTILNQRGLKEMESVGKVFDSEYHEAITSTAAPTEDLKGKVIEEVEKGYFMNDRVVRFAKVVVGA